MRTYLPRLGLALVLGAVAGLVLRTQARLDSAVQPASQAMANVAVAWVERGPDDAAVVRVVSDRADCPPLQIGGATQTMVPRAPTAPEFALIVCEAPLPAGVVDASVGGRALPVPRAEPSRIVVIGDAGCRLEEGDPPQDCDDPRAWPFARVAASAAAWQPDLVIHVGDYLYRESPCPPKIAGCAGSPWGDNWAAWQADLFTPAAPLLQAAPWVFTRGNHEICSRAGPGWFRLLDPRPYPTSCEEYTEPYAVDLGDLRLVVLDVAEADDFKAQRDQVAVYRAQFGRVAELAGPNAWLAFHRPLWGIGQSWDDLSPAGVFQINPTLQEATGNRLPDGVQLVLSGHIHTWEALNFADDRPPQVVAGNAGTSLDPALAAPLTGQIVGDTTVASGSARHEWGFTTLERAPAGWQTTLRDVDGVPILACEFAARHISCPP